MNRRNSAGLLTLLAALVTCSPSPKSDIICDAEGCISLPKFSANLAAALNNNAVGYISYVGSLPPSLGGQARTAADPPAIAMLPDLPVNIASLSKVLTTIGVLQSLASHNMTVDTSILPYLYPDWSKGPNIDTLTFRDLLTHRSGFRHDCDGHKTGYAILKQQIADGVKMIDKAVPRYNNCNLAIFRELLPFMEGAPVTGSDHQRAVASASFYITYMNQHVFQPAGVSGADCKPPTNVSSTFSPILSYPFPPGSANGNDWGDWTLACGGGGWVVRAADLLFVLLDLAGGNMLLSDAQKSLMNTACLGWDCSLRSDCPSPYVCKNGRLDLFINGQYIPSLWTYLGIFKCTVPVVVVVNSQIQGIPSNDIIGIVAGAYKGAAVPVPPGTPQPKCPA